MRSWFVVVFGAGALLCAQSPARRLISENVDERKLTMLRGNTRPEVGSERDRGVVPDEFAMPHLQLQLRRSPEREEALRAFIDELHRPGSPAFHRWLTAQQFGESYGLAAEDLNAIGSWLRGRGFTVNTVYPNGTLIDFGGTAGQVRAAFHTEIHRLDVAGVRHFANVSDPQIPGALAPAVEGILALHDFSPHPMHKPRAEYTFDSGATNAVVPADLATIYNLNPLFGEGYSGQGQTIVVIEDTDVYSAADWTTYRTALGLSNYTSGKFTTTHPASPGGSNNCSDPGVNGDASEAILDAELASAAAPSAVIELASCGSGIYVALQNLVNATAPPAILSISYGECEASNTASGNAAFSAAYQQGVSEGISIFVSAGDEAAAGCDFNGSAATHGIAVSGLASTPYNVAVGGTDFGDAFSGTTSSYWSLSNTSIYGSALSYVPEIPWNDSCAGTLLFSHFGYSAAYGASGFCNSTKGDQYQNVIGGSGGPSGCATGAASTPGVVSGTCAGTPKPSWQSGVFGIPNDGVRDLPDISLFAANGIWGHYYVFCWSDVANGGASCAGAPNTWSGAGGTSFSSPIMAGVQALINQKVGGRQGNPNYVYYPLAAQEYGQSGTTTCNSSRGNQASSSCIFYDVTLGDMDVNCKGVQAGMQTVFHNCYAPSGIPGVLSTSNSSLAPAFGTSTGWDFATGIGTVNAFNLVHNWGIMVTIQTVPAGLQFSVDGGTLVTAPQTLNLSLGSHTISAATQAGGAGIQYNFASWSDGGQASHSIAVGTSSATYTASFQTAYQLTIAPSPSAGGTVTPASGTYYAAGTAVSISASPNTGYSFANWSGSVASVSSLNTTVTMSAPETITANFATLSSGNPSKAGIYRDNFLWLLDVDNNRQYSSPPDVFYAYGGIPGDIPIAGDWNGDGHTKVGIYRPGGGLFILDANGNGVFDSGDYVYKLGVGTDPTDVPVAGDWNGDGRTKIGLVRQGFLWLLDYNGNGVFEQNIDKAYEFGGVTGDVPVVGDWNGDGRSKIGIFRLGFFWLLDSNGDGVFEQGTDAAFAYGGLPGDVPVAGDWTGNGITKVGVFRAGFFWVLDANGDHLFTGTGVGQDLAFPFGGLPGDKPVVGKW